MANSEFAMAANPLPIRRFKTKSTVPPKLVTLPRNLDMAAQEESSGMYSMPKSKSLPPAATPVPAPPAPTPGIPVRELPSAVPVLTAKPTSVPAGPTATSLADVLSSSSCISPVPGRKIHRLQAVIQREKTATGLPEAKTVAPGLTESQDKVVRNQFEGFREQVQNYLEVCDSVARESWRPSEVIDILHVLIRSLGLEVVSMVLFPNVRLPDLDEMVSRGFRTPPGNEVRECWRRALRENGRGLSWQRLMAVTADKDHALAAWLSQENLGAYGYVPIRDFHLNYGFLFVGSYDRKEPSPLASGLLELAGGRLGLTLAVRNASSGALPEAALRSVQELRNQFSLLAGCFELLREHAGEDAEAGERRDLIEQGEAAMAESIRLLEQLSNPAGGTQANPPA